MKERQAYEEQRAELSCVLETRERNKANGWNDALILVANCTGKYVVTVTTTGKGAITQLVQRKPYKDILLWEATNASDSGFLSIEMEEGETLRLQWQAAVDYERAFLTSASVKLMSLKLEENPAELLDPIEQSIWGSVFGHFYAGRMLNGHGDTLMRENAVKYANSAVLHYRKALESDFDEEE